MARKKGIICTDCRDTGSVFVREAVAGIPGRWRNVEVPCPTCALPEIVDDTPYVNPFADYPCTCKQASCGWQGPVSETMTDEDLCPLCGFETERK